MSSFSDRDVYSQTGSWLLGTVRRHPEALLLMAAGCCLMMRSGSSSTRPGARTSQNMREDRDHQTGRAFGRASEKLQDLAGEAGDRAMEAAGKVGERLKSAAQERGLTSEGLKEVAGEVANTVKDTMSGSTEQRSGASSGGPPASGSNQSFGMEQHKSGGGPASNPAGTSGGAGRNIR